jgi:hypothetical protein
MKQTLSGIAGVALAIAFAAGLAWAGDGEWVSKEGNAFHFKGESHFFSDEDMESFDLADLRDGETRTFGEGEDQVTVSRQGDEVTIIRPASDDKRIVDVTCSVDRDTCKILTTSDDPEKIMIMIQKTRRCENGEGDCDIDVHAMGHGHGEGVHGVVIKKMVHCDDEGNCTEDVMEHAPHDIIIESLGLEPGDGEHVMVMAGEPGQMKFIHADSDQVTLRCPEGDAKLHVGNDEADDVFLCPKHSVPMEQVERRVIRVKTQKSDD